MVRRLLFTLLLLLAGVVLAYGFYAVTSGKRALDTVTVSRTEIIRAVYATGTVEPVNRTMLSPEKTGRLMEIVHNEGEKVTKGDVVARMESRLVEERLQEAQEHLIYVTKEAKRNRKLVTSGAVSRKQAEDAEREYGETRERVHQLRRELEDLKLVSPVDGLVLRREAEIGETVQAGEAAFWVGSPKPLRITADVDEEDIGQVKLGQVALIKADAFPNRVFEGKVNEITPQGDPVNKVFRVRIALPDDAPLMINMTVEVNIITERIPNALVIPAESESGSYVWQVINGKKQKTPVKTGIRNETQVQILEGLKEGDVISRKPPEGK